MGNQQQVDKAKMEIFLVRKKMEKITVEIRHLISQKDFDKLPFLDRKKVLTRSIEKCEKIIIDVQKKFPKLVQYNSYYRDFKKIKNCLERVQFRPDITDTKVLEKLYPPPDDLEDFPREEYFQEVEENADIIGGVAHSTEKVAAK